MKCKSCNKQITTMGIGIAGIAATPNCKCGKIRERERVRSCYGCGARGIEIQVKKALIGYKLTCTCGHKWRVLR